MDLTSLQEMLLILNLLRVKIKSCVQSFDRYKYSDEDIKWTLSQKMQIDIASFLEEWKRLEGCGKKDSDVRDTLILCAETVRRIRSWPDLESHRNTMLAHPSRDKAFNYNITDLNQRFYNAKVPTTYAEILLLAKLANLAISVVLARHSNGWACAKRAMKEKYHTDTNEMPIRGILHEYEVDSEWKKMIRHILEKDPTLQEKLYKY